MMTALTLKRKSKVQQRNQARRRAIDLRVMRTGNARIMRESLPRLEGLTARRAAPFYTETGVPGLGKKLSPGGGSLRGLSAVYPGSCGLTAFFFFFFFFSRLYRGGGLFPQDPASARSALRVPSSEASPGIRTDAGWRG